LKAWTSHDGPFSWEGRFFHHRQVNIWPRPYQQPHPPVWITALSTNSVPAVAERGYVVATFLTGFEVSKNIFEAYRATAAGLGRETPSDRLAYAALLYTGETDEEGRAGARKLMWYIEANKVAPQFVAPPGYAPVDAAAQAMRKGASQYDFRRL